MEWRTAVALHSEANQYPMDEATYSHLSQHNYSIIDPATPLTSKLSRKHLAKHTTRMPHMAEYTCCSSEAFERPNKKYIYIYTAKIPHYTTHTHNQQTTYTRCIHASAPVQK
jgi:hypothetical protein